MFLAFLAYSVIFRMPYREITIIGTLIVMMLMLWIWFGTYYVFMDNHVLLRMGPFIELMARCPNLKIEVMDGK